MTADSDQPVEPSLPLILARELAANLATPVLLIDAHGMLAYLNEAAELMIGKSYGELAGMEALDLGEMLQLTALDGTPVRRRDMPSGIAYFRREPSHQTLLAVSLDGTRRRVEVTSYPLFGKVGVMHGVLTVFWEAKESDS